MEKYNKNDILYKNYIKNCPNCDAQLNVCDRKCPACGLNLIGENMKTNLTERQDDALKDMFMALVNDEDYLYKLERQIHSQVVREGGSIHEGEYEEILNRVVEKYKLFYKRKGVVNCLFKCPECGAELNPQNIKCESCGKDLTKENVVIENELEKHSDKIHEYEKVILEKVRANLMNEYKAIVKKEQDTKNKEKKDFRIRMCIYIVIAIIMLTAGLYDDVLAILAECQN